MLFSYNWLKWYIPDAPLPAELAEKITYHLTEVENIEQGPEGNSVLDIKILPNRAHDLLSHRGLAREIASLLNINFVDPASKYKIPQVSSRSDLGGSKGPTFSELKIEINTDKCRRYMGRIVRNVKVGPSPEWVVRHLEAIGQRSINNLVDAANLTMFDCGAPIHCFDLDKIEGGGLIIREAMEGEGMTTLDNKKLKLSPADLVIADERNVLGLAGIKGGRIAEIDGNTKNIIIEVANFDPVATRKSARRYGLPTDAAKRFENEIPPSLGDYAMREISGLLVEYGFEDFEEIIDKYPQKQAEKKLSFSVNKISKILGLSVSAEAIENILKRYDFKYKKIGKRSDLRNSKRSDLEEIFEIIVPPLRLDLEVEEDMAEEIGRVLGYDRVKGSIPKIPFIPKENDIYSKISRTRHKLLNEGYSEVMTTSFRDKGKVSVLASASDKNFLRADLADGLKESLKLNKLNVPLLGLKEVKIFEIGTVWVPEEEIHVVYNDKDKIIEKKLDEY